MHLRTSLLREDMRNKACREKGKKGRVTYTSDIISGNTVFHVELVHHGWVEIAHQNLQRLVRLLVLPVLRQLQSKQVPEEV